MLNDSGPPPPLGPGQTNFHPHLPGVNQSCLTEGLLEVEEGRTKADEVRGSSEESGSSTTEEGVRECAGVEADNGGEDEGGEAVDGEEVEDPTGSPTSFDMYVTNSLYTYSRYGPGTS